jgi:alkanesulfonate monooxygenase
MDRLIQVSRWSEEAGCTGMLVYTDNSLVDPWLVSQVVLQNTERLSPLVAVQPVYMHPYSVAKMVSSLAYLHKRRICLNMVAGGFRTDLAALCDDTPHDRRYERLFEYTSIVQMLLNQNTPATFEGAYYEIKDLALQPPMPSELAPRIFLSGSSNAGSSAAKVLKAVAVEYPKPGEEYELSEPRENAGIRIGVIAREDRDEAWQVAWQRFPSDRKGQLAHMMAMKISDSEWHQQLSAIEREIRGQETIYWLWPFKNYQTFCPYLVGSIEQVADELAKYIRAGFTHYILDIPAEESDLLTTGAVFRRAVEKTALPALCSNGERASASEPFSTDSLSVAAQPQLPV